MSEDTTLKKKAMDVSVASPAVESNAAGSETVSLNITDETPPANDHQRKVNKSEPAPEPKAAKPNGDKPPFQEETTGGLGDDKEELERPAVDAEMTALSLEDEEEPSSDSGAAPEPVSPSIDSPKTPAKEHVPSLADSLEAESDESAQTTDDSPPGASHSKPFEPPTDSGFIDDADDDDDDADEKMTSTAAAALAAVAAAASASNLSPSAQGQAARALAPGIVPEAAMSALPEMHDGKRDVIFVNGSSVKECLQRRIDHSAKTHAHETTGTGDASLEFVTSDAITTTRTCPLGHRLAKGQNDAFLHCLLLLEYFATVDEVTTPASPAKQQPPAEAEGTETDPGELDRTLAASEKVRSMLAMAEEAYNAMTALLPPMPQRVRLDTESSDVEYYGMDASVVVPDLLPPCTSVAGDPTSQFFQACLGEQSSSIDAKASHDEQDDNETVKTFVDEEEEAEKAAQGLGSTPQSSSVLSSMFSSMRTSKSPTRPSLASVFRRKSRNQVTASTEKLEIELDHDDNISDTDYIVIIDREMLGLTVENVLERTVVRTVLPGGAAKKAGAKIGSLIVKVGNVDTKNLTHFETIDELRQSQRPLKLALRPISSESLRSAREEMGRLIRGGGFGSTMPTDQDGATSGEEEKDEAPIGRPMPSKVEAFSQVLHHRWSLEPVDRMPKKEAALLQAGEKLVWILTLLTIGLEREASNESNADFDGSMDVSSKSYHSVSTPEEYADAARSVARVLYDFVNPRLSPPVPEAQSQIEGPAELEHNFPPHILAARKKKAPPPPPTAPGKTKSTGPKGTASEILFRIGDVLHRTMTFLADPASPPAALLRGEVIAFLCDVLDIDTDMELAEDESASASADGNSGGINDLGAAGNLLKLIILNCSMMRSPECAELSSEKSISDAQLEEEHKRRFGLKRQLSGLDIHRFHAGNRFLAVVHRLAASRSISARVAACSLGPVLWGHLDFPHQLQLRGVITRALHDVDVLVRKATAAVLHEIAELVFDPRAVPWLVLMCERAMTDPDPQLRALAMTLTWHLAEHLPNAFLGDASQGSRSVRRLPPRTDPTFAEVYLLQCKLLPVATRLAEDRAPSVRLAVAAQCDRLCNALGDHWYNIIVDVLQALLGDSDERVRSEAILCFPRLAEIVLGSSSRDEKGQASFGVLEALLPVSIKLQKDPSVSVRVSLATAAGELLTLLVGLQSLEEINQQAAQANSNSDLAASMADLGPKMNKKHVDETLIPLLQQLLHDTDPEVTSAALRAVTNASRGNVREIQGRKYSTATEDDSMSLSSFHSRASSSERQDPVFIPVLSEEQVLRLLPTLSGLATSRQWRVRQGAVEIVPALLGCTHKIETRSEIAQLCFRLMSDRVDIVRRTAAECLCLGGDGLASHEGSTNNEWMNAIVIPHVRFCTKSVNAKQRILALKMIEVILLNGVCPSRGTKVDPLDASGAVTPQRGLVDAALALADDKVPNVRLNVGRTFSNIIGHLDDEEVMAVSKRLQEQLETERQREGGGDRDVLFFAERAISLAQPKGEDASENSSTYLLGV